MISLIGRSRWLRLRTNRLLARGWVCIPRLPRWRVALLLLVLAGRCLARRRVDGSTARLMALVRWSWRVLRLLLRLRTDRLLASWRVGVSSLPRGLLLILARRSLTRRRGERRQTSSLRRWILLGRRLMSLWTRLTGRIRIRLLSRAMRLTSRRARPSVECQPCVTRIISSSVFPIVDKIPPFDKVPAQVLHYSAMQTDRDVRPPHPRHSLSVKLIILPLGDVVEVEHSRVIVILTREDGLVHVFWMHIGNCVLVRIPATETQIQTAHKCSLTVNQA